MGQSASQNESSFPESGVSIGTDASGESIPVPFNELDLYQQQGFKEDNDSRSSKAKGKDKDMVTTVFRWKGGGVRSFKHFPFEKILDSRL